MAFCKLPTVYPVKHTCSLCMKAIGDRYDWMTGGLYDGNEWRKYRAVPRARPLVCAYSNGSGSKGALRLAGTTWDHFRCTVEPLPGHIRCRSKQP